MKKNSLSEDKYERNDDRERENEFDELHESRSEKSNQSSGKPFQPIQFRPIVESGLTPEEEAFLDSLLHENNKSTVVVTPKTDSGANDGVLPVKTGGSTPLTSVVDNGSQPISNEKVKSEVTDFSKRSVASEYGFPWMRVHPMTRGPLLHLLAPLGSWRSTLQGGYSSLQREDDR